MPNVSSLLPMRDLGTTLNHKMIELQVYLIFSNAYLEIYFGNILIGLNVTK